MSRRLVLTLLTLCICVLVWAYRPSAALPAPSAEIWAPTDAAIPVTTSGDWIGARGAALMEVGSYRLLFGKNSDARLPMASTTKIMTAILAIESGRLDEVVTVSPQACQVEPSSIWLVPGERITLEHLVYGLMLRSGNDAAQAIAEHLGGSIVGFAEMMNRKALDLELKNTNFANPHGLPHPNHYTSAYDLAKLTAYALQNPVFSRVVATKSIVVPGDGQAQPRVWYNKNRLLTSYFGADGVKTGWTRAAGSCLVASAERSGLRVVAVVLNSPDEFAETARLMDSAFAGYTIETLVTRGQWVQSLAVNHGYPQYIGAVASAGYSWPVARDESPGIQTELVMPEQVEAPVVAGQRVGTLRLVRSGQCLAEIPLVSDQASFDSGWERLLTSLATRFWEMVGRVGGAGQ